MHSQNMFGFEKKDNDSLGQKEGAAKKAKKGEGDSSEKQQMDLDPVQLREMAAHTVFLTETGDTDIAFAGSVLDQLAEYLECDNKQKQNELIEKWALMYGKGGLEQFELGLKKLTELANTFNRATRWSEAQKLYTPIFASLKDEVEKNELQKKIIAKEGI